MDLIGCRRESAALQCLVSDERDFLLTTGTDPMFWKGGPLNIVRIEVETRERRASRSCRFGTNGCR
ncbi:hypothetical protein FE783_17980 [Paenibacillus mesophilus]|uniref:hypothetical protein n=1 Tax=Paenibacillus mesophilus TaxID=2582849 RepID=UPI00110EE75F|nr:hypothetical protein [Paenibacillus mesophilus]TMV48404.1 hypothetical protein FE783_17980 [Paenibacillus mesophilus]